MSNWQLVCLITVNHGEEVPPEGELEPIACG